MKNRFLELDLLRSLAIIGMITFHIAFFLSYQGLISISLYNGWWHILARLVQFTFIGLVGVCLAISYQKAQQRKDLPRYYWREMMRGLIVLACAMLVTMGTWLVFPIDYIRFGILHFIGVSILLFSPLAGRPKLAFILALLVYLLSFPIFQTEAPSPWLMVFGFHYSFSSLDYFPLFPWSALVLIGISLGHLFYNGEKRRFPISNNLDAAIPAWTTISGQYSLLIYMVHAPIIVGLIELYRWVVG